LADLAGSALLAEAENPLASTAATRKKVANNFMMLGLFWWAKTP
jgi:hypothetical protein